jgi:ABC-2 type transport system ATP-binding protein
MIEVSNLVKDYGEYKAVKGVTFSAEKGEILGFLGPNGAGKTTVMRILTCFLPSTSGVARVAGFDCEKEPMEVRRRIGYLAENNPLYLDMRVREYLEFAAHAKGFKGAEKNTHVNQALAETDTLQVAGKLIGQLSKGFRQRVGLAQALLGNPEVLILDEPTVGLDPRQIADIRALIKSLAGRRTIILSTHILPEVSIVCDKVVIINQGRVIEQDSTSNLAKKLSKSDRIQLQIQGPQDQVRNFLEKMDKVKRVSVKENLGKDLATFEVETAKTVDLRSSLAAAVIQKGWGLSELRFVGLALEEIFLQLVTQEGAAAPSDKAEEEVPA